MNVARRDAERGNGRGNRRGRGRGHQKRNLFPTAINNTPDPRRLINGDGSNGNGSLSYLNHFVHRDDGRLLNMSEPTSAMSTMGPPRSMTNRNKSTTTSDNMGFSSSTNIKKTPDNLILSERSGGHSRVTPGSLMTNGTAVESSIIIALTEGRGAAKCEVGMAAIDLKRPHMILCQLSDTHSYLHTLTKLHYFNPMEVIVPHTFNCGTVTSELYRLIRDQFPNVHLVSIQRRYFSDQAGMQNVKDLCAPEYANIQLLLIHKFYALTTVGALIAYLESIQCVHFAPRSLKIEYHSSQNSTLIDVETSTRLELVESLVNVTNQHSCLLSVLNYTHTSGGLRNLRANILQPLRDEKLISRRLDCIDELLQNNEGFLPALKKVIKQFTDVDKILLLCMLMPVQTGNKAGENQLVQTLQLKATMEALPNLIQTLQMAKGRWFHYIRKDLEDRKFIEIKERIKKVIQDDVHTSRGPGGYFQRCFAVRPNINGLLDVARKSYSELISDIQDKVNELNEKYGLPLRLNCNSTRGFHIVLSTGSKNRTKFDVENLPPIFIDVHQQGNTITMTTEDVVLLDHQAQETLKEIQTMSNIIICELLTELRCYMHVLYKLCEHVAELDLTLSLTQVSSSSNYVRPKFDKYLELKDSLHPILECLLPTLPVPNDVFSSPEYNFNIITGPNMGGKSIYIKQIALLQIMAQIGCFVPATSAVFRIADNIFSRIGFNDSIECNASTYVLEMKEIQYIMQTLTPTSLIIIDEFCSEEGTSMAWAICEHLLNTEAFTFFTTHFIYLTKLADVYYNVLNLHTETLKRDHGENNQATGLVYKYKILPGVTDIDNYGLSLAMNTNLPKNVIALAEDLISIIAKHKKPVQLSSNADAHELSLYKLAVKIIQMSRKTNTSTDEYVQVIDRFKADNPNIIRRVMDERKINNSDTSGTVSTRTNDYDTGPGTKVNESCNDPAKSGVIISSDIVIESNVSKDTNDKVLHTNIQQNTKPESVAKKRKCQIRETDFVTPINTLNMSINKPSIISFAKRSDPDRGTSTSDDDVFPFNMDAFKKYRTDMENESSLQNGNIPNKVITSKYCGKISSSLVPCNANVSEKCQRTDVRIEEYSFLNKTIFMSKHQRVKGSNNENVSPFNMDNIINRVYTKPSSYRVKDINEIVQRFPLSSSNQRSFNENKNPYDFVNSKKRNKNNKSNGNVLTSDADFTMNFQTASQKCPSSPNRNDSLLNIDNSEYYTFNDGITSPPMPFGNENINYEEIFCEPDVVCDTESVATSDFSF